LHGRIVLNDDASQDVNHGANAIDVEQQTQTPLDAIKKSKKRGSKRTKADRRLTLKQCDDTRRAILKKRNPVRAGITIAKKKALMDISYFARSAGNPGRALGLTAHLSAI
jgi:hypothetical protein